jgi:cytochrome P450
VEVAKAEGGEYADAVIKELLRRFPVAGNMTVRSVESANYQIAEDVVIPEGTPIHLHMWSLHNSAKEWGNPREFIPERWLSNQPSMKPMRCPFSSTGDIFDSGGFQESSLSYFPFSSGDRMCLGKGFALSILRKVLVDVFTRYHLDPAESMALDEDIGMSVHAIIIPRLAKSTTVKVSKVTMPGKIIEVEAIKKDDGWADDSDNEAL